MKNDIDGELEKINTDILFYFLLVISSGISFYIINEKKRDILDRSNNSKDVLNKMYIFNRRLIVFVNIYFLINVYNSYKEAINRDNISESELYQTKLLFWGVVFGFIGSLFYLPITNSNFIIKR
mgnify:FL=1